MQWRQFREEINRSWSENGEFFVLPAYYPDLDLDPATAAFLVSATSSLDFWPAAEKLGICKESEMGARRLSVAATRNLMTELCLGMHLAKSLKATASSALAPVADSDAPMHRQAVRSLSMEPALTVTSSGRRRRRQVRAMVLAVSLATVAPMVAKACAPLHSYDLGFSP